MDDALKIWGIKFSNVETWLLFSPLSKISGYAPVRGHVYLSPIYNIVFIIFVNCFANSK